jgi:hypothetical protein
MSQVGEELGSGSSSWLQECTKHVHVGTVENADPRPAAEEANLRPLHGLHQLEGKTVRKLEPRSLLRNGELLGAPAPTSVARVPLRVPSATDLVADPSEMQGGEGDDTASMHIVEADVPTAADRDASISTADDTVVSSDGARPALGLSATGSDGRDETERSASLVATSWSRWLFCGCVISGDTAVRTEYRTRLQQTSLSQWLDYQPLLQYTNDGSIIAKAYEWIKPLHQLIIASPTL